jgi:hypothetical protein
MNDAAVSTTPRRARTVRSAASCDHHADDAPVAVDDQRLAARVAEDARPAPFGRRDQALHEEAARRPGCRGLCARGTGGVIRSHG